MLFRSGLAGVSILDAAKRHNKKVVLFMPSSKRVSLHQACCIEQGAVPIFKRIAAMPNLNKYAKEWAEENSSYFEGSTHYQPTANYWIDLINQYFKDKISEYKFIDIGCGKGKPIIYNIVNSVGYKEYIGIEIDPVLSEIFKKNLISVNSSNAKFLNIDAFDYDYSENKCIYFFAKPFEKPIFDLFIDKIINDIIKVDCYLVFVFEQDLAPLDHKNLELIYSNEPITIYKPKEYV